VEDGELFVLTGMLLFRISNFKCRIFSKRHCEERSNLYAGRANLQWNQVPNTHGYLWYFTIQSFSPSVIQSL